MGKNSNFFGQPIYGQLIKSLDREKIVGISRKHGGEKYVKSFDGYTHLLTMLYAVIQRFDSLREIETSMTAEVRKLRHVGLETVPRRSTLSDANARRSEKFFEEVYRDLYAANKDILSSDSRRNGTEEWIKQLRIIDSTTITLFSNAIFKGVGRHPKTGKKKGGIKVHSVIHANEGVPCDVQFTSAATNDSFMLAPCHYSHNDIVALDRAYINYAKFEELTDRGVVYVTKMKKKLSYEVLVDCMYQNPQGLMEYREQVVVFRKDGINHIARIITYVDIKKGKKPKLISLLTNDFDMPLETIVAIYRRRWQIESLFYEKYIVMRSERESSPENQVDTDLLLRSTSHNDNHFLSPLSQSRRFLLDSQDLSGSRLGVRSVYAFSKASRFAFESARAYMSVVCIETCPRMSRI